MYLTLLYGALFRPRRTMRRIACTHPRQHSQLIDAGMRKMWWCLDCDATWFSTGGAA